MIKIDTTISLISTANPAIFGQMITLVANVTTNPILFGLEMPLSIPTGNVTFNDGNFTLEIVSLINGQAMFSTNQLSVGKHQIIAIYNGDDNFNSNSTLFDQIIK